MNQPIDFSIRCISIAILVLWLGTTTPICDEFPGSYASTEWPTIHHDAYNSDYMPITAGQFDPIQSPKLIQWILADEENPCVAMTAGTIGQENGESVLYVSTGKVNRPNLTAFQISDGSVLWTTPLSSDLKNPGPDSVASTSAPLIDAQGKLFVSDSQYVFCYRLSDPIGTDGIRTPYWKAIMPNLKRYNSVTEMWEPTDTPEKGSTFAKPFLTMFLTSSNSAPAYLGGISIDGEIMMFDCETGTLVASADLRLPLPDPVMAGDPPLDPYLYALEDDPMAYDPSGENADDLTLLGIWTTGITPETDDPDLDYFMNPNQISAYLSGNTFGGGSMITNTPAVVADPIRPGVSRIFICGEQSEYLKSRDLDQRTEDAILYRIDFDPSTNFENRLTVLNHLTTNGLPNYIGRMPNGKNSATSPDVSPDGRWIYLGDQVGHFYAFSAEDGTLAWMEPIGATFGSPTTTQEIDADGLRYVYAFGDHNLWVMGIDPETGKIAIDSNTGERIVHTLDYRDTLTTAMWRTDKPGYSQSFVNQNGNPYERTALAASYITATRDKLLCAFSVGWHDPDVPDVMIIPTHTVELILDRQRVNQGLNPKDTIEAGYLDDSDTCEIAIRLSCETETRLMISYGAQSTSMAQFLARNGKLAEGMEELYAKPAGGIRFVEPVIIHSTPVLDWRLQ